jgi:putative addiction module antidote
MTKWKVTKVGNSLGVVLPKDVAAALRVNAGDQLFVTEAPGGFHLSYDPGFEQQLAVAREIMRERRDAPARTCEMISRGSTNA